MSRHLLWIALALIPSTCSAGSIEMSEYFPLKAGLEWKYVEPSNGEAFTQSVTEKGKIDGSPLFTIEYSNGACSEDMSSDSRGVLLHSRTGLGLAATFKPAITLAAASVDIGQSFVSIPDVINPATGSTVTCTSKIAGWDDVTTPAGKFTRCLRIEVSAADTRLGTRLAQITIHLAKDVGIVKRAGHFFGIYFVHELSSR